jgi:hypothetical protein
VIEFCEFVNRIKFSLADICEIMSTRIAENSAQNGGMRNEKIGRRRVIECKEISVPAQMNMYDIRESFPDEIAPASSISVIPYEQTDLNNIVICRKIYSVLYDSAILTPYMAFQFYSNT